eukprot:TRINITY_DN29571_c0_g1_i1.p1 TRINITY_DN29571_c0_g1~~TRINITY_DN29571_c0_g1_i1.p1  ORF type:complete len:571 (+),score=167.36 TRINITY_DN29571_c0_g1_i1:65-1777(+)
MDVDPRTGLAILSLKDPQYVKFRKTFGTDMDNRMLHWIGEVKKVNRHWNEDKRILIVSDECLYLCLASDGNTTRCVRIGEIQELIETRPDAQDPSSELRIALRLTQNEGMDGKYDLLFKVASVQQKADVIRVVDRCHLRLRGEPLHRRPLDHSSGEDLAEALTLKKPKQWHNEVQRIATIAQVKESLPPEHNQPAAQPAAASPFPREPDFPARDREEDRRLVHEEFERIRAGLRKGLTDFRQDELEEMQREIDMYAGMIEERDAEIEGLREQANTLTGNPEFWKNCPRCRFAEQSASAHPSPAQQRKRELERRVEDQQQLIKHLQFTRTHGSRGGYGALTESAQTAELRQKVEDAQNKVRELQRLIVENPFPTEDVRIRAERIAQGDDAVVDDTPELRQLQERADRLDRELVAKERQLRHQRNIMRDAFKRQVQELHRVRTQFQEYDRHIVNYLEKTFAANAFPQGGAAYGQTPRELAEATSQAARQAATPAAFPQHTVGVGLQTSPTVPPLHMRSTSRRAASPIGQFVAPNVVSDTTPSPSRPRSEPRAVYSQTYEPADQYVWQRRRNL